MGSDWESLSTELRNANLAAARASWDGAWLRGERGWTRLLDVHNDLVEKTDPVTNTLPSGEWLRFIRGLGADELAPGRSVESTAILVRDIAASLSARSRATTHPTGAAEVGGVRWREHDQESLEGLLRELTTTASILHTLQAAARWVGKGAGVRLPGGVGLAYAIDAPAVVRRAVEDYDDRAGGGLLHNVASTAHERFGMSHILGDPFGVAVVFEQPDFFTNSVGYRSGDSMRTEPFRALCSVRFGTLSHFVHQAVVSSVPSATRPSISSFALGCWAILAMLVQLPARSGLSNNAAVMNMAMNSQIRGFHAAPRRWLDTEPTWVVPKLTAALRGAGIDPQTDSVAHLIGEMLSTEPSVFPPTGPPLRALDGGWLAIDFVEATKRLGSALTGAPAGGRSANLWSRPFEDRVQAVIDDSSWSPNEDARRVRRVLRLNGTTLTDIDAVGSRNHRLLIVDAKARSGSDSLQQGAYNATNADAKHAAESLANSTRVVSLLRDNPIGDNYDLSMFRSVEGAVCYPYLPFSIAPQATQRLRHAGIHRLTFLEELTRELA